MGCTNSIEQVTNGSPASDADQAADDKGPSEQTQKPIVEAENDEVVELPVSYDLRQDKKPNLLPIHAASDQKPSVPSSMVQTGPLLPPG